MKEKAQKGIGIAMIPILSIFALGASQGGVNAGMATMAMNFPDAGPNIGYVVSMVALGMIPAGILSGILTGRFIKYKTTIIIAMICYVVSGIAPFFLPDDVPFATLLVFRFIFGVAVGWSYPLASALTFKLVHNENQRATWLGVGMAFFNIGTIFMELAGGYLALVSWQHTFLVYLIGIIPLVLVATMLKEPPKDIEQEKELAAAEGTEVDTKIPAIVWPYVILLTCACALAMPTILYCSMIMASSFGADAGQSGLLLSAMTVVGMLSGFTLGPCYKALRKWLMPVACLWLGIIFAGCAIFAPAPGEGNMILYIICFLVGHWGFAIIIPGTSNILTNLVPIGAATKTMGVFTAFHQAGCFLATPVATMMTALLGLNPMLGPAMYHDLMLPCCIGVIICGALYIALAAVTKMRATEA